MDTNIGKLTTIITTVRHGEKSTMGELTENGVQQAKETGLKIENLQGDVILLHSGVNRVKESLEWMAKSLYEKTAVEVSFSDYTSHYLQYLYNPQIKGEYFGNWDAVDGNAELELLRMKNFLAMENNSSEPQIYPSPREMAVRLARVIATEIDFATITIPEVVTNFINGSHEPVIMAFLYYFLQDFQPKDPNFLETIKGTLGFSEGFEIKVYENLQDKNTVIFKFREITKILDQNQLKDFCKT